MSSKTALLSIFIISFIEKGMAQSAAANVPFIPNPQFPPNPPLVQVTAPNMKFSPNPQFNPNLPLPPQRSTNRQFPSNSQVASNPSLLSPNPQSSPNRQFASNSQFPHTLAAATDPTLDPSLGIGCSALLADPFVTFAQTSISSTKKKALLNNGKCGT